MTAHPAIVGSIVLGNVCVATANIRQQSFAVPLPAELAGLTRLSKLTLVCRAGITGGWEHLPRQLQHLRLDRCGLQQLPEAVAGLTQLAELWLDGDSIEGGWQHLPRQQDELGWCLGAH